MINIIDKPNCCGCNACNVVCPKQCISMPNDHEGFFYPVVNQDLCIDCGLCEKACPVITPNKGNVVRFETPLVYAAYNIDENIRIERNKRIIREKYKCAQSMWSCIEIQKNTFIFVGKFLQ